MADRYITVDFTGRRRFTLIETESTRWSDYIWNDGKGLYNVYRESIHLGTVESVSIWYNSLPKDQETRCVMGPVKARPMVACTVRNPTTMANGKSVVFPVEMPSGSYLEFNADGACMLYGSKDEAITQVELVALFLGGACDGGFVRGNGGCNHTTAPERREPVWLFQA